MEYTHHKNKSNWLNGVLFSANSLSKPHSRKFVPFSVVINNMFIKFTQLNTKLQEVMSLLGNCKPSR